MGVVPVCRRSCGQGPGYACLWPGPQLWAWSWTTGVVGRVLNAGSLTHTAFSIFLQLESRPALAAMLGCRDLYAFVLAATVAHSARVDGWGQKSWVSLQGSTGAARAGTEVFCADQGASESLRPLLRIFTLKLGLYGAGWIFLGLVPPAQLLSRPPETWDSPAPPQHSSLQALTPAEQGSVWPRWAVEGRE